MDAEMQEMTVFSVALGIAGIAVLVGLFRSPSLWGLSGIIAPGAGFMTLRRMRALHGSGVDEQRQRDDAS